MPDNADKGGFSAAWGVVAVVFGGGAVATWSIALSPKPGFPVWPGWMFSGITVFALYLCFAPLLGWPGGRGLSRGGQRASVAEGTSTTRQSISGSPGSFQAGPGSRVKARNLTILNRSPAQDEGAKAESNSNDAPGGRGGSGHVTGARATVTGGRGGRGGITGPGGDGGSGFVTGDDAIIIGGDGGDAGQPGGVGGRGGRGPSDRFGTPSNLWGAGRGGRGSCTPECSRILEVLSGVCREYSERFPDEAPYIDAGLEQVPTDWLNQRLVEMDERWRVDEDGDRRALRQLDH